MIKYFCITQIVPTLKKGPFKFLISPLNKFLAINWMNNELNLLITQYDGDLKKAWGNSIEHFGIKIMFTGDYNIPTIGPLQVIANHGGELLDVFLLGAIILPVRKDLKFIATQKIKSVKLFNEFSFYTGQSNAPIQNYQLLANYLSQGNVLCHFSLSWEGARKNQSKNIKYHKPLSSLSYFLQKRTHSSILPINLQFKKTWRGNLFLYLEEKILHFGLNGLASFLMLIDIMLAYRTLRAMQGKTITITVGDLITETPPNLTRPEATKWVGERIGIMKSKINKGISRN